MCLYGGVLGIMRLFDLFPEIEFPNFLIQLKLKIPICIGSLPLAFFCASYAGFSNSTSPSATF